MIYKCKKCGSTHLEVKPQEGSPHYSLHCKDCGSFIRWMRKDDAMQLLQDLVEEERKIPDPCPFCDEDDLVIVRAYGDDGICSWDFIPVEYCPACGRPKRIERIEDGGDE